MTEPEDQPGDAPEAQPAASAAAEAAPTAAPSAATTAQQPPVPPHTALPPFAGQPYPPGYAPYPFAPVVKEPWFNPAKRTTIMVGSILLALVLLGGGILIGAASSDHHGRDRGVGFYAPMNGPRQGPPMGPYFQIPGNRHGKGHRVAPGAGQPAPSPTSATSS